MCKIYSYLKCIFLLLIFISCSANNEEIIKYNVDENLHTIVTKKNEELIWTRELESVRLLKDTKKMDGVASSVKLSKNVVIASENNYPKIYPYLEGFGSLDTTLVSADLDKLLKTFASSLCFGVFDESLFNSQSVFSFVLFQNDLKNLWKELFKQDMPSFQKEEQETISNSQKVFTSWVVAKPFVFDNEIQVPIRFKKDAKYIDVMLFVSVENKIEQIQITQWGEVI